MGNQGSNGHEERSARDRLFASEIDQVMARLEVAEAKLERLEQSSQVAASALLTHGKRIERLRIDKQIIGLPSWLWRRLRSNDETPDQDLPFLPKRDQLLLIAPKYPTAGDSYGGQPVQRRVRFYRSNGLEVVVFVPDSGDLTRENSDGVEVIRGTIDKIPEILSEVCPAQICWHHPSPDVWPWLRSYLGRIPIHVWIHGFEARPWRELAQNYATDEIVERGSYWDALEVDRRKLMNDLFLDKRVTKVFVSQFMRDVAESFAGVAAINAHVIHNVVDTDLFKYRKKEPAMRQRVVAVRSFAARNYGTDLLSQAIQELAGSDAFTSMSFEIYGDGKHFEEDMAFLHKYPNVSVFQRFLDPAEMVDIFGRNGVLLIPTRWDSQGMTLGEGMASGLVPVTNAVASIPEFVDTSIGVLAPSDDISALARGLLALQSDPDLFLEMSASAAERARRQTGPEATVGNEVELLRATVSSF